MAGWRSGLTRWSAKPLFISSNLILASKQTLQNTNMDLLMAVEILVFSFWIFCIAACYKIAENEGRNKYVALFAGLVFSLPAVIIYLFLGKKHYDVENFLE